MNIIGIADITETCPSLEETKQVVNKIIFKKLKCRDDPLSHSYRSLMLTNPSKQCDHRNLCPKKHNVVFIIFPLP